MVGETKLILRLLTLGCVSLKHSDAAFVPVSAIFTSE